VFYLRKDLIELPRKLSWILGMGGKVKERVVLKNTSEGCGSGGSGSSGGRLINSTPANLISKQKKYNYYSCERSVK